MVIVKENLRVVVSGIKQFPLLAVLICIQLEQPMMNFMPEGSFLQISGGILTS